MASCIFTETILEFSAMVASAGPGEWELRLIPMDARRLQVALGVKQAYGYWFRGVPVLQGYGESAIVEVA